MADSTIDAIATAVAAVTGAMKIPVGDGAGDGVQRYMTPDLLDAYLQTLGASRIIMSAIGTSAFGLSNVNTAQAVFPTGQRTVALEANKSYLMEGCYYIASGTTTHTTGMSFTAGGGLTIQTGGFEYTTWLHSGAANAIVTASSQKHNSGLGAQVLNATSTAARTVIAFEGRVRINAGGTLTPNIIFSAAPGGTNQTLPGSFIRFTPWGGGTAVIVPASGAWT